MKSTSFREHRELGDVAWLRDYDAALAASRESGKPIFLLFQEVPGCSTCVNYGQDVLSHPLMVEAIHDQFVPLAIFNNHEGRDAEILRKYSEPAWNNPVVHFVDSNGEDIVQKVANRYDAVALYNALVRAIEVSGRRVPDYVRVLGDELLIEYGGARVATYNTPCFWSGETSLAQNPGVLTTDAGWIGHEEVVRLHYDPSRVSEAELDAYARDQGFTRSKDDGFRLDKDPQFYLKKTDYRYLPLSAVQRSKINVALPYRQNPEGLLSPLQRALLNDTNARKDRDLYRDDIRASWPRDKVALAS